MADKPPGWPNGDGSYLPASDAYWAETVDSWGWTYRPRSEDFIKSDNCPCCGHPMTCVFDPAVLLEAAEDEGVNAWCNCAAEHRGRPPDRLGCGQRGRVRAPEAAVDQA